MSTNDSQLDNNNLLDEKECDDQYDGEPCNEELSDDSISSGELIDKHEFFPKNHIQEAVESFFEHTIIIQKETEKSTEKAKSVFRFPFIVTKDDLLTIEKTVHERIAISNPNAQCYFSGDLKFYNNEVGSFSSIDSMDSTSKESPIMELSIKWTYIKTNIGARYIMPIPFDIIVHYEVEQDVDKKELMFLHERGVILVEGDNDDWVNGTLNEIKKRVDVTKMPPWWYYPKLFNAWAEPYLNILLFVAILTTVSIITLNWAGDSLRVEFLSQFKNTTDIGEKLDLLVEFIYKPSDYSQLAIYGLGLGVGAIIYGMFKIGWRKVFPPSMVLLGTYKSKAKNKYTIYCYVWSAILIAIIGALVVRLI